MLFSSDFSKLMWFIKRKLNVTQKEAYRLAVESLKLGYDARLLSAQSIFDTWSPVNARAVAGHLWGLHKAYRESGDKGRSIAFYRASKLVYDALASGESINPACVLNTKFVRTSLVNEVIDFYLAGHTNGYTPRTLALVEQAPEYRNNVHRALWHY